jgi:Putative lumazine-binding
MRRFLLLLMILLSVPLMCQAQEAATAPDKERDAVRQVVETYLYSEEPEERKRTLYARAKILSVDPDGIKVVETAISKPSKKLPGRVTTRSRQKILSIDLTDGGASVKVETDLSSDTDQIPKHIHFLSLLKINDEWKIVSILMPPIRGHITIPK